MHRVRFWVYARGMTDKYQAILDAIWKGSDFRGRVAALLALQNKVHDDAAALVPDWASRHNFVQAIDAINGGRASQKTLSRTAQALEVPMWVLVRMVEE